MIKIFTVYDSKAEAFLTPFFSQTTATAIRSFEQAANDPQHQFHLHPGDYTLFEIGEWHEIEGQLVMNQTHLNLGTAITYITHPLNLPVQPVQLDEAHLHLAEAQRPLNSGDPT